jgi:hypothetical protein
MGLSTTRYTKARSTLNRANYLATLARALGSATHRSTIGERSSKNLAASVPPVADCRYCLPLQRSHKRRMIPQLPQEVRVAIESRCRRLFRLSGFFSTPGIRWHTHVCLATPWRSSILLSTHQPHSQPTRPPMLRASVAIH